MQKPLPPPRGRCDNGALRKRTGLDEIRQGRGLGEGLTMSTTTRNRYLAEWRDEVTGRMEAGQPFDEVEHVIELSDVTEDQKAALWLMAFAMRDRREQERDARAHLAVVSEP